MSMDFKDLSRQDIVDMLDYLSYEFSQRSKCFEDYEAYEDKMFYYETCEDANFFDDMLEKYSEEFQVTQGQGRGVDVILQSWRGW